MNPITNPLLEIQKKVLATTFAHNMAALKIEMPDIYQFYKNYTPKNVQLIFDENNNINLINNGELVYQGNPLIESNKQVEKFVSTPVRICYQLDREGIPFYEHEKVLQEIVNKRELEAGKILQYKLTESEQIDFVAFMGSGLGYHLESLFAKFAIRSALIYEPDADVFYATLHNIDLKKLIENCQKRGGELVFKIGGEYPGFVNEIATTFSNQGYFHISRMYLYRHYASEKTDNAFKMVHNLAHRYVDGWGFCEDEIIGISHTLDNISIYQYPSLLTSAKLQKRDQPVFIIGNGPSLDKCFEYLKTNQNNAIIISSGTALKPLLDNGIIPDVHIEQERPVLMYEWVKKIGHEDKLKKIDLICLNTVYHEILSLFKQAYIILKPRDAGATFIKEYISGSYAEVLFCNPTVTNAATAATVAMGFKNLYLFGVDYGFKSEDHHHSKDSLHYKDNEGLDEIKMAGRFKVPANFKGEVLTTKIFDSSRMALEMLLQENPDVTCVNTSDGAKIQLSTPCQLVDLPQFNLLENKKLIISNFLKESFSNKSYKNRNLLAEFEQLLPKFKGFIRKLRIFTEGVKTRTELVDAFSNQHKFMHYLEHNSSKVLFERFMGGTLSYLQSTIMANVYFYIDKNKQEEYIRFCLKAMDDHFEWLLKDLGENYNKPAKF